MNNIAMLDQLNNEIRILEEKFRQITMPKLTNDPMFNWEHLGQHYIYCTEWSSVEDGTYNNPTSWFEDIDISAEDDFFYSDIVGTLCYTDDSTVTGGNLLTTFNYDIQMRVEFRQDNQFNENEWMPINLYLGSGSYPKYQPQWRGVKAGTGIRVHFRSFFATGSNYYYIKVGFVGFKRKVKTMRV